MTMCWMHQRLIIQNIQVLTFNHQSNSSSDGTESRSGNGRPELRTPAVDHTV